MKRWLLALFILLLFAAPVYAERPRPDGPPELAPLNLYLSTYQFPAVKDTIVERPLDPHARARLTVAGEDWEFTLIQRRWGWELETAFCASESQNALALASLDYLNGQPGALTIFFRVPLEYSRELLGLRK